MIEHELLFLGLLAEGPKHGYEIKRRIKEVLSPEIGLNIKSIYYPLKRMEEAGLVAKQVGRQGRWPQKNIYGITAAGRDKFDELMGDSFLSVQRPFFHMDLSLYFLHLADQSMVKRRLKARITILKKISKNLSEMLVQKLPQGIRAERLILQHDYDLVQAEISSTEKLIRQL